MEPPSHDPADRDLEALVEQMAVDRARIDAVTARIDALELEVPLGQVEMQEEIDRLENLVESALARLAKLEAAGSPPARARGVIGALRVERPPADASPPD